MKIGPIRISFENCIQGVYLRWWFNGWHYFLFRDGYEILMKSDQMDIQVTKLFSRISKVERPTRLTAEYSYKVTLSGITPGNISGFIGLLQSEIVEQYENNLWYEVDITRGEHLIRDEQSPAYILDFEITRKELPNTPAVYRKSQKLYLNDIFCDLDDGELIPINKQVNDIAEMQDRQSDFTAQFKIRKTRRMKALLELSGETGANTTFPFRSQIAKLIQENIEMITRGKFILEKGNDQYYDASIYSGNLNFFREIEKLKLSDLLLTSTNHTWNAVTQAASNAGDLDYCYPLLEPSDDGGIAPLTDDGNRVEMYGGWIWPFIKLKAIWDEIFLNAGFICEGDILTNSIFLKMFMPIISRNVVDPSKYLYSMWWQSDQLISNPDITGVNDSARLGQPVFNGINLITGNAIFLGGYYHAPFNAKYKLQVIVNAERMFWTSIWFTVYVNAVSVGRMAQVNYDATHKYFEFETEELDAGDSIQIWLGTVENRHYWYWSLSIVNITGATIAYDSIVEPRLYLPNMTQIDFIKMICNWFGLIPDTNSRDHKILFWNLTDLYDNIAVARDWSNYLSELEDESEFKFGEYAQNNYLRFKDSDDVKKDTGKGNMQIEDETLPFEKNVVSIPVSTCDEVEILTDVNVSRINFNKWNPDTSVYDQNESIDPRIVYISRTNVSETSPVYEKTFGIRDSLSGGTSYDTTTPQKASSVEVSFPYLITNYAALSRLLTKTNLRKAKFNLPVYEVAELKHNIPIYLRQYKAYFYVNKINNYIPGKLCVIDLIKL